MPTIDQYRASRPPFVADRDSLTRDGGHQIDWANVGEEFRATPGGTVTVNAIAAQGATSITTLALPVAVKAGQTLDFGGAKFARVTADAAAGALALTVAALPTALAVNDVATVKGSGFKRLPAGKAMSAADAAGNGILRPRDATHPATCLLLTAADEGSPTDARTGYGVILGGVIYESMLPDASGSPRALPAPIKAELAAAGVSTGFVWRQYADSSAA